MAPISMQEIAGNGHDSNADAHLAFIRIVGYPRGFAA
jgi:hypothetical protein